MGKMATVQAQIKDVEILRSLYIIVPVNTAKQVRPDVTRTGVFQNDERKIVEILVDFDKVHVNVETHGLRKNEGKHFLFSISLLYSICLCKIGEEWRGVDGI